MLRRGACWQVSRARQGRSCIPPSIEVKLAGVAGAGAACGRARPLGSGSYFFFIEMVENSPVPVFGARMTPVISVWASNSLLLVNSPR
jgi:hypothetical protein